MCVCVCVCVCVFKYLGLRKNIYFLKCIYFEIINNSLRTSRLSLALLELHLQTRTNVNNDFHPLTFRFVLFSCKSDFHVLKC